MTIHEFKAKYGSATPGLLIDRCIESSPNTPASLEAAVYQMLEDLESALESMDEMKTEV